MALLTIPILITGALMWTPFFLAAMFGPIYNANRSKKIPQTESRLIIFVEILNNFFITHWETMQKSVCPKYLIKFDKLQTKNMTF